MKKKIKLWSARIILCGLYGVIALFCVGVVAIVLPEITKDFWRCLIDATNYTKTHWFKGLELLVFCVSGGLVMYFIEKLLDWARKNSKSDQNKEG